MTPHHSVEYTVGAHSIQRLHVACVWFLICFSGLLSTLGEDSLTNQWVLNIKAHTDSSPAVGNDGTIYLGTFDRHLWAINPDGTRKWVFTAGLEIWSSPAVAADSTIYFGSRDRKVYAVGADGGQKWTFPTGGWVDSSPALANDGTVYIGSWDGNFYALTPNGTKRS